MRSNYKPLGKYIREVDNRDTHKRVDLLLGVSIQKRFMPSIANTIGTDMSTYKIVKRYQFAYGPVTSRNGDKISIALLEDYDEAIVSQAYMPFEVIDTNELLPQYLMMWFRRPEFDRYARFMSHGSAREIFGWEEMCNTQLPVPHIDTQREIVKEYNTVVDRINLNNQLIQKLEETAQAIYKQWFVDEVDIENLPEGWRMGTLDEMSETIIAGVIPKYTIKGDDVVLGQKCVHDSHVDLVYARPHEPKENCILLKFGDILINSTGKGTLGRVGQIYFDPKSLAFDSNITLVRAAKDRYIDYLGCFLSRKESHFVHISQGSTDQTRLYCSMVRPLEILIPSQATLEGFKTRVRAINLLMQRRREENKLLKNLKDLLLSKLATIEN